MFDYAAKKPKEKNRKAASNIDPLMPPGHYLAGELSQFVIISFRILLARLP